MIFFNNNPLTIYIRKKSLEFIIGENRKSLEFPADVVSDADIIDSEKYEKLVSDFIAGNNLRKQKVLLVLSEDIVFDKTFPLEDSKIIDDKTEDFLSMVPIEPEKISKKTIKTDKGIYFFAVNKDLFEKLVENLEKIDFEVIAAVPLTAYTTDNNLTSDLIGKIHGNSNLLTEANLLSGEPSLNNNSPMGKIILALIVLAGIAFAGWYAFPFLTKNQKPTPGTAQITPAPQATVTPASALSSPSGILNKDQLKVSVLNGTGIAGQAAKVKDLLVSLGLSKIETGNVSGETVNETTAVFSSAVATDLQKQIITLLEENYASVSAKKSTASPSADIVITTGKPK